uniref:Uncharacterized protein n=1 Tax=Anguilla anguilla TaxID=7936 RepID=A0A0E9QP33_ANGAN
MADFLGCCYQFIQFKRGRLWRDERQTIVCVYVRGLHYWTTVWCISWALDL